MIFYQTKELWEDYGEALSQEFEGWQVRPGLGLGQTLLEALEAVSQFYPLKKTLFYFSNQSPTLTAPLEFLSRKGFKLKAVEWKDWQQESDSFLEVFDKESLALVSCSNDPFFGQIFSQESLSEKLIEKKIHHLMVSHAPSLGEGLKAHRLRTRVEALAPDLALAFFHKKARVQFDYSSSAPWSFKTNELFEVVRKHYSLLLEPSAKETVLSFEKSMENLSARLFFEPDSKVNRLWDRAIVIWEKIDGAALIEALEEALGLVASLPGRSAEFETLSLSRWGGVRSLDINPPEGLSLTDPEKRGLVIFSLRGIHLLNENPGALSEAIRRVEALQSLKP